jgi:hypothetical protein
VASTGDATHIPSECSFIPYSTYHIFINTHYHIVDSVSPWSPNLTAPDFHFWGHIKDKVYVPPLPQSSRELRDRICDVVRNVNEDMLHRVWDETAFRWNVCITHWAPMKRTWMLGHCCVAIHFPVCDLNKRSKPYKLYFNLWSSLRNRNCLYEPLESSIYYNSRFQIVFPPLNFWWYLYGILWQYCHLWVTTEAM